MFEVTEVTRDGVDLVSTQINFEDSEGHNITIEAWPAGVLTIDLNDGDDNPDHRGCYDLEHLALSRTQVDELLPHLEAFVERGTLKLRPLEDIDA